MGRRQLAEQLAAAGLPHGHDVLVHCSLRAVGPVDGGPGALLTALRDVIGPQATVVVPTQTANNSTTGPFALAATAPTGFDRATTPSFRMGRLAEHVRTRPGAVRSAHPQTSFCGLGPSAAKLMAVHTLDCHLGEESPLGTLYTSDAWIALLGVGFERCTALHLAEQRLPWPPPLRPYRCFVRSEDGGRVQRDFDGVDFDASDFHKLGAWLAEQSVVRTGPVGNSIASTLPIVQTVDLAVDWMTRNRSRRRG